MSGINLVSVDERKDGTSFVFEADPNNLGAVLNSFFIRQGYRLEKGTVQNGVYGKGSAVARFFLGGFVARFKFAVEILPAGTGQTRLTIRKAMIGVMGGLLGLTRMNNEYERIVAAFRQSGTAVNSGQCPHCGTVLPDGAQFCPGCGRQISSLEVNAANNYSGCPGAGHNVRYAGFWTRCAASFIDGLILLVIFLFSFILFTIILLAVYGDNPEAINETLYGVYLVCICITPWFYYAFFESSAKQATPGKIATGSIVTDKNGQKISFMRATVRYWSKIISCMTLMIGFIIAGLTSKKQALHDIIAGCLVIKKPEVLWGQKFFPAGARPAAPENPAGEKSQCPICGFNFETPRVTIATPEIIEKYGPNPVQCPNCRYIWSK